MNTATQSDVVTGTRDVTYDLISVAYHALQGAETYGYYANDALQAGDQTCHDFFLQAQEMSRELANEAKNHLRMVLSQQ